jgi:oligopeptide/dipeptide ABC transporter ATP-binding protein
MIWAAIAGELDLTAWKIERIVKQQLDPRRRRICHRYKLRRRRIRLEGEIPNPIRPPPGCHFHTCCPIRQLPLCSTEKPPLKETADGHWVACHLRS